jgi:cytidylate kinase
MPFDATMRPVVERACEHWERRREATRAESTATTRPFTIAIAREAGAGASTIATELGRRLGWTVYDRDLVEQIAREMGLRSSLLQSVDERHVGWVTEGVEQFLSATAPVASVSESAFVRHLIETVLALGVHGECIVVGRGSTMILPPETTLRVRAVAPFEDRVRHFAERRGLTQEEAGRQVRLLDRERLRFARDHFFKDPEDPRHVDLVVNTSRLSAAGCVDAIVAALHDRQQQCAAPELAAAR